jgi:hypothetical protein
VFSVPSSIQQSSADPSVADRFKNIEDSALLSRRFILKRYLGLTDDEIQMNEVLRKEEQNIEDTAEVSAIQQLYDKQVYENRTPIKLKGDEAEAAAPTDDFGADGLGGDVGVDGSGEEAFGGETEEEPSGAEGLPPDAELAKNFGGGEETEPETPAP